MEHWESSIKKEQERIEIKFRLLNKFKYIYVNFFDGYGGIIIEQQATIVKLFKNVNAIN